MTRGQVSHVDGSPAPGVAVANGAEVVTADDDGRFRFDGGDGFTVLSRPDGYTADPWFHTVGVDPADFILRPIPTSPSLCFAQVTDLHLSDRPPTAGMEVPTAPDPVVDALDRLLTTNERTSLLAVTGDLTDTGLDSEYEMVRKVLDFIAPEVIAIPGNHDHMAGDPRFLVTDRGYGTNHGDPNGWERHMGPRWFSLDRGGLHLVVVDWHTWELGLDRNVQKGWLVADLAHHTEWPWVLFSHDQMPEEFFEGLQLPVATFSGHWHTTRSVRVGSTVHVNTPPLTFGGLDYSRAGAVIAEWDGANLTIESYGDAPQPLRQARLTTVWSSQLGSRGGLAAPVAVGDDVVCATTWDEDTGKGCLTALDLSTGVELWRLATERASKTTPVVAEDRMIVADVAAGVLALDPGDGNILWQADPVAPLRTWCWTSPVVARDQVVVSTPTRIAAYRLANGELTWERIGLVPHSNLVSHSSPVVVGDTIVVGFWPFSPCFFGLDATSGEVVWSVDDPEGGEIEGASGRGTALGPWSPVGPGVADSGKAIFPTSAGWAGIDAERGELLWQTADVGQFRSGRPALAGDAVIVTTPDGVRRLRMTDGTIEWSFEFSLGDGIPLAPYRATPHVGTGGPSVIGNVVVVPGLDGALHRFDAHSGADLGKLDVGVRSAATPLVTGRRVIIAGVDGTLHALPGDEVTA